MSKEKKIVSTTGSLMDGEKKEDSSSRMSSPGLDKDGKKKSGLVGSLYNYSRADTSGASSGRNSDSSGGEESHKKVGSSGAVVTESDLLERYHRGLPIRSADVLKLTKPTESSFFYLI
jgi:hypothetical protein